MLDRSTRTYQDEPLQWERGLPLPEGPGHKGATNSQYSTACSRHHQPAAVIAPKQATTTDPRQRQTPKPFVPAAPPKTNPWGLRPSEQTTAKPEVSVEHTTATLTTPLHVPQSPQQGGQEPIQKTTAVSTTKLSSHANPFIPKLVSNNHTTAIRSIPQTEESHCTPQPTKASWKTIASPSTSTSTLILQRSASTENRATTLVSTMESAKKALPAPAATSIPRPIHNCQVHASADKMHPANAWGVTLSGPVSILTRTDSKTPNNNSNEATTLKPKKSKKGKPKLKNMLLGDLITKHPTLSSPKQHILVKPSTLSDEFPALSTTVIGTKPTLIPKLKVSTPKPAKNIAVSKKKLSTSNSKAVQSKTNQPKLTPDRSDDDEAFSLMRKFASIPATPGRQRFKPRKKKFTPLKKKVLEERLRKWKELNPEEPKSSVSPEPPTETRSMTVELRNFLDKEGSEDLEDEDEYQEVLQNLRELAEQCGGGSVKRIFIPRTTGGGGPVFCEFADPTVAQGALSIWNGLVLGGQSLQCRLLALSMETLNLVDDAAWQAYCLNPPPITHSIRGNKPTVIMLENVLTEEDLEDDDCLEESLNDIRDFVAKHGTVLNVSVSTGTTVKVEFANTIKSATETLEALSQMVLGGQVVSASGVESNFRTVEEWRLVVLLENVLTDDDLEDEDALLESIEDIQELAAAFGELKSIRREGDVDSKVVRLEYATESEASKAYQAFQGMIIGGETVVASRLPEYSALDATSDCAGNNDDHDEKKGQDRPTDDNEPKVMYSGDKIISERFAECKRVPKIPNKDVPRHYAKPSNDAEVKPILLEMLAELMRLQKRAIEEKNTKAKRRLVMGLREVARGIRSHKVKMVVMATNLDEYGALDEKLLEIIDLCATENVPIFYELSKRAMGKAIGKTIKVAVIGVQSAEGAHQQFKKLMNIAARV